jgi:uncharacterized protein
MDSSVTRYDFSPITRSVVTDEGYLKVWCRAARTGIQTYTRADGSKTREYRPPEEVSNPESLATFGMKPVTWKHPPERVDAANSQTYRKGFSGSNVRYTDGFVEVALMVEDPETVSRIQANEAQEVSAGYTVDYDPTPGVTPDGHPYDGVQKNIRVNHIAIVPKGRAGPEVRLLLDHLDAADAVAEHEQPLVTPRKPVMATLTLDGLGIELPSEAAAAVQSFVKDARDSAEKASDRADAAETALADLQARFDALTEEKEAAEGRADALQDELDSSEGRMDTAALDQLLVQRLNTLQTLAPAFAADFKFDGLDEEELYSQAFENLTGSEMPEDASFDYIKGAVDGILAARGDEDEDEDEDEEEDEEELNEDSAEDENVVNLRKSIMAQRARADAAPATSKYREKLAADWTKPLTATK